jgi:hypothetical protein
MLSGAVSEQIFEYLRQPSNRSDPLAEIKQNQWWPNTTLAIRQSNQFCSDTALIMDRGQPLLSNGDGVRFELVRGDALRRKALLLQQLSKQSPRRSSAASSLDQEVEHLPFIVDRPPQPVFPIAYRPHRIQLSSPSTMRGIVEVRSQFELRSKLPVVELKGLLKEVC